MPKPEPGLPITVEIEGRSFRLRYPFSVLKKLQADYGISVLKGQIENIQDIEKLSILLYCGLLTDQPEITQEWVDEHAEASMLRDLLPKLAQAMFGATVEPRSPNGESPEVPNTLTSPGLTSGLSDATTSPFPKPNSGA